MLEIIKEYGLKGLLTLVITGLTVFVKNLYNKIKKQEDKSDGLIGGMQCLLRSNILDIYYKVMEREYLYQWERDSLDKTFSAYIKIGGNSFIQDAMSQIAELPVKPNK